MAALALLAIALAALADRVAAGTQPAAITVRVYDANGNRTFLYYTNAFYSQDAPTMTVVGLPLRYIDQPVPPAVPLCPANPSTGYGPVSIRRNNWVALSFRCSAPFASRAAVGTQLGAAAVIVVEPDEEPSSSPPLDSGSVSSVSVSNITGREIYQYIGRCSSTYGINETVCNVFVDIRPGTPTGTISLLVPQAFAFALILFFCTMCCCLYIRRQTICACLGRRSRFDPALAADEPTLLRVLELQQTASQRQHESAAAAVAALPFEELSPARADELSARQDACAVCLDGFEAGTCMRTLACSHVYHRDCIDPWLTEHGTCPLCKAAVIQLDAPNDPTQAPLTDQQLYLLLLHLHLQRRRRRSRAPPEVADYLQALTALMHGAPRNGEPVAPPWPREETAFAQAAHEGPVGGRAVNPAYDHSSLSSDDQGDDSSESEHDFRPSRAASAAAAPAAVLSRQASSAARRTSASSDTRASLPEAGSTGGSARSAAATAAASGPGSTEPAVQARHSTPSSRARSPAEASAGRPDVFIDIDLPNADSRS